MDVIGFILLLVGVVECFAGSAALGIVMICLGIAVL